MPAPLRHREFRPRLSRTGRGQNSR